MIFTFYSFLFYKWIFQFSFFSTDSFINEKFAKPLIIAHRGYPGLLPDHTMEGYTLAIENGADFIECDLVMTKDNVLICRHEPMLSGTTNVAELPQFSLKKTTKIVDGVTYANEWFVSDFTLTEIRMLRAKQPMSERPQIHNGKFLIPTFQEVIDLAKEQSRLKGRTIGIYPETKHPSFHKNIGLPLEDKLLFMLEKEGWNYAHSPVYVQSFEVSNLQYIRKKSSVKLIQLYDASEIDKNGNLLMNSPSGQPFDFVENGDKRTYLDLTTNKGLTFVKTYADGIGVWKPYIIPYKMNKELGSDQIIHSNDCIKLPPTDLVERAHKLGLYVHAYTFRDESYRLLSDYKSDPILEYKDFYNLGVDGVFTDFTATAVKALN